MPVKPTETLLQQLQEIGDHHPQKRALTTRLAASVALELLEDPVEAAELQSQGTKVSPAKFLTEKEITYLKGVLAQLRDGADLGDDARAITDDIKQLRKKLGTTERDINEHENLSMLLRNVVRGLEHQSNQPRALS